MQTGSGSEYEEGRGPGGTEPSRNLRALLSTPDQIKHNPIPSKYENLPKDVPPPMVGKMWILWVVCQRMVARPDPGFVTG